MSSLFDLSGKVAMVTGASQGLGRRFAAVLAGHGAKTAVTARQADKLDNLVQEIAANGGIAQRFVLDVTRHDGIEAVIDEIEAGLGPIDILINNAGVAVSKAVLEQSRSDWDHVIDTNLKAAFFVAQEVAKGMCRRKRGAILNIASVLALEVVGHLGPYAISKAGLWQMTRAMALELARFNIRVNALAPGYVETDMNRDFLESEQGRRMQRRIPLGRFGRAEDLDGAMLLLVSNAGCYMTGSMIVADGGMTLT